MKKRELLCKTVLLPDFTKKTLLLMLNWTITLTFLLVLKVSASSYSQNLKVDLDFQNVKFKRVLSIIEQKGNIRLLYSEQNLPADRSITLSVKDTPVMDVLGMILKDTKLGFRVLENGLVVISPQNGEVRDIKVSGTVTDAKGETLPGVSVKLKGTTIGATTDLDGRYTINVADNNSILVFTYVGFTTQEVPINGRSTINVKLEAESTALTEVVVVGYGTQKKADLTGAISTVSGAVLAKRPATNTALALQGMSPGLTILNGGGEPGRENVGVRIRGVGTLGNSNPLVLVDGIEQSLSTVEPSNIESLTVLKDAASAAIYGSRAANGVILIKTKRGAESGISVSYNNNIGWKNQTIFPEKADPVSWLRLENEAQVNAGGAPAFSEKYIENVAAGTNPLEFPFANWEDGIFNYNAPDQRHSVTISSGGANGKMFASADYFDSDGILQNFNNKQISLRLNSDLYVSKKLTLNTNLMYRNRDFSGPGFTGQQIVQGLLHTNRSIVSEYPDGTYDLVSGQWNPRAMVSLGETSSVSDDIIGQVGFTYAIHKVLSLEGNVSINSRGTSGFVFNDGLAGMRNYLTGNLVPVGGWFATNTLRETQLNQKELSQRAYLNYNDTFDKHKVQAMSGYEEIGNYLKQTAASRDNFFSNDLRNLSAGAVKNQTTGGSIEEWRLRSFFGRINYSFDDKYLFQANIRYDGSSRFREGNRWGLFPSFSAGWRISEEKFLKDSKIINTLKLRGSWGQLGNQNIGLYRFQNNYNLSQSYQFGGVVVPAAAVTNAGNPDITWETSTMTNIGLDMGFLNDRLEVVTEYFWKYTDDILLNLPIPSTIGVAAPLQNAAAVSNKGWEVAVNYSSAPRTDKGFQYSVGVNFSNVVNKIEDLKGAGPFFPDKFTVWTEGESINSLRGLKSPGLYRTDADLKKYPATLNPKVKIGDIIYEDLNGDGVISQSMFPAGDQYIMANEDPKYEFGIRSNASYRGFDIAMFWQGVLQQEHTMDGALIEGPNWQNFISAEMARETYHPVRNPVGSWPLVTAGNTWNLNLSDFWLQDTRYLRLKNLQIGYTIPQKQVASLRVHVSGENMLTFTPTKFFDPETPRGRSQFSPHTKIVSVGVNVRF
jgi:TonB-linked SusC/RagA family outer membrane protein